MKATARLPHSATVTQTRAAVDRRDKRVRADRYSTSAATAQATTKRASARIVGKSDAISSTKMCATDSPRTSVSTIDVATSNTLTSNIARIETVAVSETTALTILEGMTNEEGLINITIKGVVEAAVRIGKRNFCQSERIRIGGAEQINAMQN